MTVWTPEPVYAALWAQASKAAGFVTLSRRLRHWENTPKQPALFQVQPDNGMLYAWRPNNDPKVTFYAQFFIYTNTNDPKAFPSILLNTALGNVLNALECPADAAYRDQGRNTLGGLVYDCRINGKINTFEGIGQDKIQSVAIVPVEILVTH